jgi:pimeloyl-ACP methyl ester carboxylesterase
MRRRFSRILVLVALGLACADDASRGQPSQSVQQAPDAGSESSLEARDAAADAADIAGTWLGTLQLPPIPIRLVLNITRGASGDWSGTADSPDQGSFGIPITSIDVTGDQVLIRVDSIGLQITATLSGDGQTLTGTLQQGAGSLPFSLVRQAAPLDYRRPQDPLPPFPYDALEVSFPSADPAVTLAGTLLSPRGTGPFPTVVLITGSGAQNRNEELLNHRPFLVLADALARANVAVLRYDDRGVGSSTGDFAAATSLDFAQDVRGAISYLRTQTRVPVAAIGLVGHSEGGLIAPMVADGDAGIGFLVLLAGPAVDGATITISQGRAIGAVQGASEAELDANEALQRALFGCIRGATTSTADAGAGTAPSELDASSDAAVHACLQQLLTGAGLTGAELERTSRQLESPWMRFFLSYDPAPALRRTRVPVLALNGSLDLQVLASVNLPVLREALAEAGNAQSLVAELPGLNHLFQHAQTGAPSEYGSISETLAPEVLTQIADWIGGLSASAP